MNKEEEKINRIHGKQKSHLGNASNSLVGVLNLGYCDSYPNKRKLLEIARIRTKSEAERAISNIKEIENSMQKYNKWTRGKLEFDSDAAILFWSRGFESNISMRNGNMGLMQNLPLNNFLRKCNRTL